MITIREASISDYEFFGLSTDVKPTENVGNGASLYEIDTGDIYLFDQENKKWWKQ